MDMIDLLPNYFCCIFPLAIRKQKDVSRPEISAPVKKSRLAKNDIGCGPDGYQRIVWLHSRPNYTDLRKRILKNIIYDSSRTLVVWCPQHVVSNDYVISLLNQYGEVDHLIDNFSRRQCHSERRIWYGTIVEYSAVEDASAAYNGLPLQCRHIKVLPLTFMLSILVDCELLYGGCSRHSASTLVVSGRRSLRAEKKFCLYLELSEFGNIANFFSDYRRTTPGVICKVTYSFFTQAYLAMMMLDGQNCDDVLLSTEIEEEREEIIEQAKKCLMMAIESYF